MALPVHAQQTAPMTDRQRVRLKAGADLCTRDPARWSAMVRYEDQLRADVWSREDADRIAWEWFVPEKPWSAF